MQLIILALIFIAEFFTSPKILLFYDQIEYLKIVSTHSFWQVFSLGHFPIHPFFLSIFWITSRLTIPNYTAFLFGMVSGILMYQISKIIFAKKMFWLAAITFLIFPGVWIVNTNLMIQSILLTFYLISTYCFLKNKPVAFLVSNFIMLGIHIDAVYWIASIFLIPFLFSNELKITKREIGKYIKLAGLSILLSLAFYAIIYIFIRKDFGGSTEQLFAYSSFGFLRIIRNIWVCFINSFGSFTPLLLIFLLIKKVRSKPTWIAWVIFILLLSIGGAYWAGDLMMRRIVFAGVILSLGLFKYLGKKIIFLILLLLPITILNSLLYFKNSDSMPLSVMQKNIDQLPKNQILVTSHYYYPFINYQGKILWFEADNLDQIDGLLKNNTRVFMTKESITAPYLLVVGNNYHITSMNKVGNSEARSLFSKYKIDTYEDSFELKLFDGKKVSENAGEPVIFYGDKFLQRLSRMRINYGDVGIWLYSFVSGHKDAITWTYKDATGAWVWPNLGIN